MMARVTSAASYGFDGKLIEVECDSTKGLPVFQIVGLGDKAIGEARERVKSAITNSHLDYPAKRLTVNLAPANLPKDGAHFDLPVALSILLASGQLKASALEGVLSVGELSLNGELRPIRGIISLTEVAKVHGLNTIIVPLANAPQAALVKGVKVLGASTLADVYLHLLGEKKLLAATAAVTAKSTRPAFDLADIRGQAAAKRALVIAAAGHHNLLLDGPPGAGKTMLAKALSSLLPKPSYTEQLEITKLHSLSGEHIDGIITERPFRSPHHTASTISLIGGGTKPQPGEVSLAHHGVLFMDEIPEYPRSSLEALRQPLEDGEVHVSRAAGRVIYPANFILVATKNPCPCGFYGDPTRECDCTPNQLIGYRRKLSGPLLDRIDMRLGVNRVAEEDLLTRDRLPSESITAKADIAAARVRQARRQGKLTNADLPSQDIADVTNLSPEAEQLLNQASAKLKLSARSYFKLIKVARTIADLANSPSIQPPHVAEALQYR